MKDNFDLKQFLVENKMTEASRGNVRKHFLKECDMMGEAKLDKDLLYKELTDLQNRYGMDKGLRIFTMANPGVDPARITPKFARQNKAVSVAREKANLNRDLQGAGAEFVKRTADYRGDAGYGAPVLDKDGNIDTSDQNYTVPNLEEAGYTDDFDSYDDDFGVASGSDLDLGIPTDARAEKAARRGMKGTDLDVDVAAADDSAPEYSDMADDDEDGAFEDPEDMDDAPDVSSNNSTADLTQIFGANAPCVEVLVDDLDTYLKGPRGNWRVNVSTEVLRRAVDAAKRYLDEFEYPKNGIVYLQPNKGGHYDMDIHDKGNAVVAVHRDPIQ